MTISRTRRRQSRVPILIAVLCVLMLALINWYALTVPIETSPIAVEAGREGPPATPGEDLTASASDAPAVSAFPQTLARPLFRPSRRLADAEEPKAVAQSRPARKAPPAKLPDNLALVGIMTDRHGASRALIRSGNTQVAEWLSVGRMLGGWRLSRIEAASVVLEAGGQEQRISLFPSDPQ